MAVVGEALVEVVYEKQKEKLLLIVVEGNGPTLFGQEWLTHFTLNWEKIHLLQRSSVADVLQRHLKVFNAELGTLEGYEAKLHVDPAANPRFYKAQSVPYSLKDMIKKKLDRLVNVGIIEPVQFADWAALIVPVLKSDGKSVRICGDFKLTVNQAAKVDKYPVPKIQDLFAQVGGGKKFTKLDLSQAYQQAKLDEVSKAYIVINTHRSLFRYNRLPFGVASAPSCFQRVMESLLKGIPGVVVYTDDVLVIGKMDEEHLAALEEVLQRLEQAGLRLQLKKCSFMVPSVIYLGHQIDAEDLHPVAEKIKAIKEAPEPQNRLELKSYLGLLLYYSRFMPNMSTTLAPLYRLLRHDTTWR